MDENERNELEMTADDTSAAPQATAETEAAPSAEEDASAKTEAASGAVNGAIEDNDTAGAEPDEAEREAADDTDSEPEAEPVAAGSSEPQEPDGEAGKKRTFKAKRDGESAKRAAAPAAGPTDDVAPDEEQKRTFRADTPEPADGATDNVKKKTYRSDIEDYDENDATPADSVFQYKPGADGKRKGLLIALISVAAVLAIVVALALFGPEGNPVATLYDNLFNSSPLSRGDAVMSVAGEDVSRDMYLHLLLSGKAQVDAYYPDYFVANPDMFDQLKTLVEDELRGMSARERLAIELGAGADDADRAEVEGYIGETKASYSSDIDYDNALTNNYLTEELYRELLLDSLTAEKLYAKAAELPEYSVVTAEQAAEYAAANGIMCAKHILLLAPADADEATKAQKLALANEIIAELNAGGDFDALMVKYTEDPGIDSYPDGYTFTSGEMVAEFESAVAALEIGATSGVVESSYGYHIIKRLEPDYTSLTDQIITERIDAKVSEYAAAAEVKYARGYERITLEQCVWPYSTETVSSVTQQPAHTEAPAEGADGDAAAE